MKDDEPRCWFEPRYNRQLSAVLFPWFGALSCPQSGREIIEPHSDPGKPQPSSPSSLGVFLKRNQMVASSIIHRSRPTRKYSTAQHSTARHGTARRWQPKDSVVLFISRPLPIQASSPFLNLLCSSWDWLSSTRGVIRDSARLFAGVDLNRLDASSYRSGTRTTLTPRRGRRHTRTSREGTAAPGERGSGSGTTRGVRRRGGWGATENGSASLGR